MYKTRKTLVQKSLDLKLKTEIHKRMLLLNNRYDKLVFPFLREPFGSKSVKTVQVGEEGQGSKKVGPDRRPFFGTLYSFDAWTNVHCFEHILVYITKGSV